MDNVTSVETAETMQHGRMVTGLRELADFLEANPDFPEFSLSINVPTGSAMKFTSALRQLGNWEKEDFGFHIGGTRWFGPIKLDVYISKFNTCKRIVKGERIVPASPERAEPIVEWECPESFLDLKDQPVESAP